MNILIPHSWLLEHLDTAATPEEIQKYLSLCGPSVERIHQIEGEPVYDIEVTTNRVDTMSVRGIAQEAAAILPSFNIQASLKPLKIQTPNGTEEFDIEIINNPNLCPRITAIKIEDVTVKPSPSWLQKRLMQVGQRPLNNLIDITNYVMWEIGHPVHAFDYDKISDKKIVVREAKKGEQIITLDGKVHRTNGGEIVFDNGRGEIIDLPGIMGTKNTIVSEKTKNVLLWIEDSDPTRIRKASMGLAIRTQAAVLNEKGVDPELALPALYRGVELYRQIADAKGISKVADIYPESPELPKVVVTWEKIDKYLNLQVTHEDAITSLKRLNFSVKSTKKGLEVIPTSERENDIKLDVDIIEEIARIWGYHKFESLLPTGKIPQTNSRQRFEIEWKVKQVLKFLGFTEFYADPLISKKDAELFGGVENHLKLANPLGEDWAYLRSSLLPTLLKAMSDNQERKPVSLFEMNEVFKPNRTGLPDEQLHVTLATHHEFRQIKGRLEALSQELRIPLTLMPKDNDLIAPGTGAIITSGKTVIGFMGIVNSKLSRVKNLHDPIWIVDLNMDEIKKLVKTSINLRELPNHEAIVEDMTLILSETTLVGPLLDKFLSYSPLLKNIAYKGRYENAITLRLEFNSEKKQLTQEQVNQEKEKIISKLKRDFAVVLKQ